MKNKLQKILIIGNGGSGKTTLSTRLAQTLNHPILHLDSIYWIDGWKKNSLENFENHTHEFMKSDCWIIEGTPMYDIQFRLDQADTIIFLDINRTICILRLIKRAIKNIYSHSHSKMVDGPANFFSLKAAIWIWNFNKLKREKITDLLLNLTNNKKVFFIKNNLALKKLLNTIE